MKKVKFIILVLAASLLFQTNSKAQDTNWVKTNTWYFDNFVKDILPWSLFRETFIGVAPTPSGDFDLLFYNTLFKDQLAAKGHCYGIDVMAMLMKKNGGHLGYCHPPYKYSGLYVSNTNPNNMPNNDTTGPLDPNLRTAIAMVHGYQINHSFLLFLLDVMAVAKNRNGSYAADMTEFYLAKDDPPVISVTKGLSPAEGGHVIVPYKVQNMGGNKKRIYVYDPNRSFYKPGADGKDWYVTEKNFIEINTTTKSWKFEMVGTLGTWAGDPSSGGNCIVIPVSVAGKRDRLPQSLLAEGAYALNTIFIHGNVSLKQISDPATGQRYYNKKGTGPESNENKKLTNWLPFIPMGINEIKEPPGLQTYFFKGTNPLHLQYRAYGEYSIGIIFRGQYLEVKGNGNGDIQYFKPDEMRPKKLKAF